MASVYSSNYSTGTYTYTRVRVDYPYNNDKSLARAYLLYNRTNDYAEPTTQIGNFYENSGTGASTSYDVSFTGQQTDATVDYITFSIPPLARDFDFKSESSVTGVEFMNFDGSVRVPTQIVASITNTVPGTDSITLTGGIDDWWGGINYTVQLIILNAPYTTAGIPQNYEEWTNALTGTRTITNSSLKASGGITISPNTTYYKGVYVNATYLGRAIDLRYDGGTVTTLAPAPTVSVNGVTDNTIVIDYSTVADGGALSKNIEYSLDGGVTWQTGTTVSTGSASSGSFTISGLTAGTTYTIQTRVSTTSGSTSGSTLTATTSGTTPTGSPTLYGSVNGATKKVDKLYGSVNGQTKRITKLYGSVNGTTKLIFEG